MSVVLDYRGNKREMGEYYLRWANPWTGKRYVVNWPFEFQLCQSKLSRFVSFRAWQAFTLRHHVEWEEWLHMITHHSLMPPRSNVHAVFFE